MNSGRCLGNVKSVVNAIVEVNKVHDEFLRVEMASLQALER